MRARDEPQGARRGVDRVEVEGEFHPEAIFIGVCPVIGMPAGVSHIPIGVGGDADHIVAVELLGDTAEARVFEEAGVEGRARMQHRRPVALFTGERLIGIYVFELGLVFAAQGFDLFRREQVSQNCESEGSEVLQLRFC